MTNRSKNTTNAGQGKPPSAACRGVARLWRATVFPSLLIWDSLFPRWDLPGLVRFSWSGFLSGGLSWSGFWEILTKVGQDFTLSSGLLKLVLSPPPVECPMIRVDPLTLVARLLDELSAAVEV